jgi:putative ABC transport system permease protein
VYGDQNWATSIQGTGPNYPTIRAWAVAKGSYFTDEDVKAATKVAVLGQTVVDNLFGSANPIGQIIRIKGVPFRVLGVLDKKGGSAMGQDQDDLVCIPYTTAQKRLMGVTYIGNIIVSAVSPQAIGRATEEIRALLRQRHRIGRDQDDDFEVRSQQDIANAATQMSGVLTVLLGAIASVSLLVGGIGIMNIMLVSVTERTREIGLRMAIGAKGRDVLLQFLVEAIALSLIGGGIGIALGFGLAEGMSRWMSWPAKVPADAVMMAFGFAAAVGVFFGFYPAQKASRLDPIDALRFE